MLGLTPYAKSVVFTAGPMGRQIQENPKMLSSDTLRPGLLVSLKTSAVGNVQYRKQTIEEAHITDAGEQLARWETTRTINDPAEHAAAAKARTLAGDIIRGVCVKTAFGLLCPEDKADKLEEAVAKSRRVAEEFNATAKLSRVAVYIITGRIAPDDVEAVRAINSEVRDLLQDMETGLRNLDVKTVRDAANRARNLGGMLSPAASDRIQSAIEIARASARKIVKAGEQAAGEVDLAAIKTLEQARTAFLDLDEALDVAAPAGSDARGLDLAPIANIECAPVVRPAIELE